MIYKLKTIVTLVAEMEVDAGSESEAIRMIETMSVQAMFNRTAVSIPRETKINALKKNLGSVDSVFVHSCIITEHSGFKKAATKDKKEFIDPNLR